MYRRIGEWAKIRNRALHELVKLAEDDHGDWAKRYQEAKDAAVDGKRLFREVDTLVRRLNKKREASLSEE